MSFTNIKYVYCGRRRVRDKNIPWKETYTERSSKAKEKFEKMLPGSYFRWQGFDTESLRDYYVVVGPAESKKYGKAFFAGIKKLPLNPGKKSYAPSGKYFPNLAAALTHAHQMWGTPFPKDYYNYQKQDLAGIEIPKHIKG